MKLDWSDPKNDWPKDREKGNYDPNGVWYFLAGWAVVTAITFKMAGLW